MSTPAERLQHKYYTAAADKYYEGWHGPDKSSDDGVDRALQMVSALIDGFGYQSVLDVGTGTGRSVKHFLDKHPGIEVRGVEPVRAMIDQAERAAGVPEGRIIEGRGEALPFEDSSFDVVCEFGILHHVRDPNAIVREMTRVSRRAVFLSDVNRFANGSALTKATRYGLYRLGLWSLFTWLRTRGRGYMVIEGDGVIWSYSVYEALPTLSEWANRIFIVPTEPSRVGWFHPLFGAPGLLVCGLRDG